MNLINKDTGEAYSTPTECERALMILHNVRQTEADCAWAVDILRNSADYSHRSLVADRARLATDMADIALIDSNLARGHIREKQDDTRGVILIVAAVFLVMCVALGAWQAWAGVDPVTWAVGVAQ